VFDPNEFLKSTAFVKNTAGNGSAFFFIFTCGCGYAGCFGWEKGVEVKKNGNSVLWSFPDYGKAPVLEFDSRYYASLSEWILPALNNFYYTASGALQEEMERLKTIAPGVWPKYGH
jgi:hypothetical protein